MAPSAPDPGTSPGWSPTGPTVSLSWAWSHQWAAEAARPGPAGWRGAGGDSGSRHHSVFVTLAPAHTLLGRSHSRVTTGQMCVEDRETSCWFMPLRRTGKVQQPRRAPLVSVYSFLCHPHLPQRPLADLNFGPCCWGGGGRASPWCVLRGQHLGSPRVGQWCNIQVTRGQCSHLCRPLSRSSTPVTLLASMCPSRKLRERLGSVLEPLFIARTSL